MTIAVVMVPFVGLLGAIAFAIGHGLSPVDVLLAAAMYLVSLMGLTMGFHRLFTHNSFEAPRAVRATLAICGSMAAQGPVIRWVAQHRRHHAESDTGNDLHSPHAGSGFWRAHLGWLFEEHRVQARRYAPDLLDDTLIRRVDSLYLLWLVLSLAVPAAIGGLVSASWAGAFSGFLWGGLARIAIVHQVTWCVNSICHLYGARPFKSRDQSTNNWVIALLALGEGWHNNHHAFPTSASHGLRWWQVDTTAYAIRLLSLVGWARNLKRPSEAALRSRSRATVEIGSSKPQVVMS